MKDWTGISVIVLGLGLFALYGLLKDTNAGRMNPRREIAEDRKRWEAFQYSNLIAVLLSFLGAYLLIRLVKWIWMRWNFWGL